jgi:hypothetical protein
MEDFQCSICRDSKHILIDGIWQRCPCLIEHMSFLNYATAGITFPPQKLILNMSDVNKEWPSYNLDATTFAYAEKINALLKTGEIPTKIFCFQGSPTSPKDFIIQCILKTAVDAHKKVKALTMTELISLYFEDKTTFSLSRSFNQYDIFSVFFGIEIQSKVVAAFLQELIRLHLTNSGKHCLLLQTSLPLDIIGSKYGDVVKSLFIRFNPNEIKDTEKRVIFMGVTN